jgi:hypothetical protein
MFAAVAGLGLVPACSSSGPSTCTQPLSAFASDCSPTYGAALACNQPDGAPFGGKWAAFWGPCGSFLTVRRDGIGSFDCFYDPSSHDLVGVVVTSDAPVCGGPSRILQAGQVDLSCAASLTTSPPLCADAGASGAPDAAE